MSRLRDLALELHRRNAILAVAGWGFFALGIALGAAMPFDNVELLGVDRLAKPLKFCFSIQIYLWSLAWFSGHIEGGRRVLRWVSGGIVLTMTVEIVCIAGQALRGQRSHFNVETAFGTQVFNLMGQMIALNTLLAAVFLVLFFRRGRPTTPAYRLGIVLGLCVFLLGSGEAAAMLARGAHAVGAPDGGPGLPLLNWSTTAGDLRVAHLLGLHSLQVLPLVGWWLGRRDGDAHQQRLWMWAFATAYVALTSVLFVQAMAGVPLISL